MTELSNIAKTLTGQPMFRLLDTIKALEKQGEHFIHFEIGDPDFGPPRQLVNRAISILIEGNHHHYCPSQGLIELREEIAWFHGNLHKFKETISPEQVVIAPGCNPLIYCVLKCICNEGDTIHVPDFSFPTYRAVANLLNLKIGASPRLSIINYPSNPSGRLLPRAWFDQYTFEGFVISDEIYQLMTYTGEPAISFSEYDQKFERTAVIGGYSKSFGMTGWRIGYMISSKELAEKVSLLLQTIVSCTNTFVQKSCVGLLHNLPPELKQNLKELEEKRDLIAQGLQAIDGIDIGVAPEGAFYIFPNIKGTGLTSRQFVDRMLQHGVGLLPGSDFGEDDEEKYVRLAYCISKENIEEGLKRITEALRNEKEKDQS